MAIKPETDDLTAYLKSDPVVDSDNPVVAATAARITAGIDSDISAARALYTWVRDNVSHSYDAGIDEVTCSASQVLGARTGICYAKSHLLAAMLRSRAIPAGFCYQFYADPLLAAGAEYALHGLNGIYLESLSRWIRVDCRGNKDGVAAEFDVTNERLAFPEMEFLDDVVYANPLPSVISALTTWNTCSALWPNLPSPPNSHKRP